MSVDPSYTVDSVPTLVTSVFGSLWTPGFSLGAVPEDSLVPGGRGTRP